MKKGYNKKSGSACTSFKEFQDKLVGLNTTSLTIAAGNQTYTCNDSNAAKQITDTLGSCKSSCTNKSFNEWSYKVRVSCNGENWYAGNCNESSDEISIGDFCSCKEKLTMRPCISNAQWGGHGGNTCSADDQTFSISAHHLL